MDTLSQPPPPVNGIILLSKLSQVKYGQSLISPLFLQICLVGGEKAASFCFEEPSLEQGG
jgi:hypothetical protein